MNILVTSGLKPGYSSFQTVLETQLQNCYYSTSLEGVMQCAGRASSARGAGRALPRKVCGGYNHFRLTACNCLQKAQWLCIQRAQIPYPRTECYVNKQQGSRKSNMISTQQSLWLWRSFHSWVSLRHVKTFERLKTAWESKLWRKNDKNSRAKT